MQLQEMNSAGNASHLFREAEACLFMMTTLARRLSFHDPEGHIASLITSFVLPCLASKPPPSMQEVVCILFSELAVWIVVHPEIRRQIVEQLVQIIEGAADLTESNFEVRCTLNFIYVEYSYANRSSLSSAYNLNYVFLNFYS